MKAEIKIEDLTQKNKELNYNIIRTDWEPYPGNIVSNCRYVYKFQTSQFLEAIDDYSFFGIGHDSMKQHVIDTLVFEFRISLNTIVFGDPAGKLD